SNEKMNEIREEHKRLFNNTSEYEKLREKCMKLLVKKTREEICKKVMKKFQGLSFLLNKKPTFNNNDEKNIYKLCEMILIDNCNIPVELNMNIEEENRYLELKKKIEIPNKEEAEIIETSRMKFEIEYIKNYNNLTKKLTQFPFLKNKLERMSDYPFYRIICLQSADQTINVSSEYKKFRNEIVNQICGFKVPFLEDAFKIYDARFDKKSDDFDTRSFDRLESYVNDQISKKLKDVQWKLGIKIKEKDLHKKLIIEIPIEFKNFKQL
ncbi:13163_t:CDS:1, partial [Cetraspora pellucida]